MNLFVGFTSGINGFSFFTQWMFLDIIVMRVAYELYRKNYPAESLQDGIFSAIHEMRMGLFGHKDPDKLLDKEEDADNKYSFDHTTCDKLEKYFEENCYAEVHLRETCEEDLKNLISLPGMLLSVSKSGQFTQLGLDDDYRLIDKIIVMHPNTKEDYKLKVVYNSEISSLTEDIIILLKTTLDDLLSSSVIDIKTYNYYIKKSWFSSEIVDYFKFQAINECKNYVNAHERLHKYKTKIKETELLEHTRNIMQEWLESTGKEMGELIRIQQLSPDYIESHQ
jgi:arsenate reductase-like glutaredoxin family protein